MPVKTHALIGDCRLIRSSPDNAAAQNIQAQLHAVWLEELSPIQVQGRFKLVPLKTDPHRVVPAKKELAGDGGSASRGCI